MIRIGAADEHGKALTPSNRVVISLTRSEPKHDRMVDASWEEEEVRVVDTAR